MQKHLLTLYTRTPLHVGCGTSVDVVDLPIMRERITGFPVIPSTSLKGVLRQAGRDATDKDGKAILSEANARALFGEDRKLNSDEKKGDIISANAGCVQIMEGKLLAFPVRSLAGCFAWLTCPAALRRFQRDSDIKFSIPDVQKDQAIVAANSELIIQGQAKVVLEEYALTSVSNGNEHGQVATALSKLSADALWTSKLTTRLAILHDEDFQHFVTTCTEVVARIVIDPATRTNTNLFNQENIPCEALFYTVLTVLAPRRKTDAGSSADTLLTNLLTATPTLQIGGDETTGHGFCAVQDTALPLPQAQA